MRTAEYEEKMAQPLAREALKEAKRKAWEAAYPDKAAKYAAAREAKKKDKGEQQALATEATETVELAKTNSRSFPCGKLYHRGTPAWVQ